MYRHVDPPPLELLRNLTGDPRAEFREHQLEAIDHLVNEQQRVLCVQRTGWGKSAVYFIATSLLRQRGAGPTLLISPLLALMRNQMAACGGLELNARTVNSANCEEWDAVFAELEADAVDLLLISPERLNNAKFRTEVAPGLMDRVGLLVVDEAHCISDWGHDFRPDYRRISSVVDELRPSTPVLCTTATANDRVVADIKNQLSADEQALLTIRGSLDRSSLRLEVVDLPSTAERLAWLATHVPRFPGSGIIYCLTIRDTDLVASWLRSQGIEAEAYSGQSNEELRVQVEDRLARNEFKAVVATSALGMGYDKPDLGFVIHFQAPGTPVAYYQQVGRAGRQINEAHGVLLRGAEDREIQDYFIGVAFPPRDQVERVLDFLRKADSSVPVRKIEAEVNIRHARLMNMLKTLEVDGAVIREGRGWRATQAAWEYDDARVAGVTAARRHEQALMERYGHDSECLMEFLRRTLDDPHARPCGRCAVCTGSNFADFGTEELVRRAAFHIRRRPITLPPRKRWAGHRGNGPIPDELRAEPGRALSTYGDAGWGKLVARGKWKEGRFADELVHACAELIDGWRPEPLPTWVTAVPSLNRPRLVADFAYRLAAELQLPYYEVVEKTRQTPPQKEMQNSAQQADNISGAFSTAEADVRPGPVLLIDDVRDSGWTATEVAACLRNAGSGPVFPLALALAGGKG